MLGAQSSQYDSPPNKSTQEVLISMGSSEISGGTPSRLTALSRGSTRTDLKRTKSQDKYGDSTSQRHSDTSEQSSIDQSVLEGIRTLAFVDMSEQKDEPSLWLGTNRGSVFGFSLDTSDESGTQGPHYNLLGSLFKFDGEVVFIGFGNAQGEMCPPPSVKWDAGNSAVPRLTLVPNPDELIGASAEHNPHNYAGSEANAMKRLGGVSHPLPSPANSYRGGGKWKGSGASGSSLTPTSAYSGSQGGVGVANSQEEAPTGSAQESDRYFMVVISEKHAQVIGFPSRNCHNRVKITETSTVVRAEISNQRVPLSMTQTSPFSTLLYVNCLLSNGHLIAFSLPSLRILSDVDAVTGGSIQQSLFTFGNLGHAVYFASPSELAKITLSADLSANLSEMYGELFLPCNMPEPPKKNFFTNLFTGSGLSTTERDALLGEQHAGKSTSAALLPSGRMERLGGQASGTTSEIARARNAAIERGEKLGQLDVQAQEMMEQSKNLSKTAAMLAAKYEKQDKWWGVWPR
ncbi:unnamed protein product [Hymenolepis diminuta]|uniref:V-SNARE coiled-coil homology domain-containing protein n=1 Tax=Hymenolepis diminuta TaxID=6216 RepID=A0A564Y258_HYMDI|nr:unnamed protein product [Hymenolepis diminuta]